MATLDPTSKASVRVAEIILGGASYFGVLCSFKNLSVMLSKLAYVLEVTKYRSRVSGV